MNLSLLTAASVWAILGIIALAALVPAGVACGILFFRAKAAKKAEEEKSSTHSKIAADSFVVAGKISKLIADTKTSAEAEPKAATTESKTSTKTSTKSSAKK